MTFRCGRRPRSRPRVLLASGNGFMAERLRGLLSEHFDVVGVVGGWGELEEGIEAVAPDVVVADIAMPPKGDQVAALRVVAHRPGTPLVLLSAIDDWALIQMRSSAGTHGYVVKDDVADELVHALEEVLKGRGYLSTSWSRQGAPITHGQPQRL